MPSSVPTSASPPPLPLPLGPSRQRDVASLRALAQHRGEVRGTIRAPVRASWERSLALGVAPELEEAPLRWDEDRLREAVATSTWLPLAQRAVLDQHPGYVQEGHILSLFDARGRMLWADGDPHVLEGLRRINFRPGGDWSEAAAGTNGPGTALAAGHPVHVVGREHFCRGWEAWHCAAAPIRDPLTGEIRGVVDLSGREEDAHPHTLALVSLIAAAVERGIAAQDGARNARVLREMARIIERWPRERVVALDRAGGILGASSRAGSAFAVGGSLPPELLDGLREAGALEAGSGEPVYDLPGPVRLFPLLDGADLAGSCLLLGPGEGRARGTPAQVAPPASGTVPSRPPLPRPADFGSLLGRSPAVAEVRRLGARAAANRLPVLLLGESGTGKEVVARAIHGASSRAEGPFVAVNCAAVPGELAAAEFFGYVSGAFSGALKGGRPGHFVAAHGGTLFLDEVGELPLELQAALLRVLQEGVVTPVGSSSPREVDVRIVAATNRDLPQAAKAGAFRRDLFHRLHVLSLELPPLRHRGDDVVLLARHFLLEAELEQDRPGHTLDPEVLEAFRGWNWPGNVRELKNLMQRLVALAPGARIGLWDLPAAMREERGAGSTAVQSSWPAFSENGDAPRSAAAPEEDPLAQEDRRGYEGAPARDVRRALGDPRIHERPRGHEDPRAHEERRALEEAIRRSATMKEAAATLGVGRSTLYRRLEKHGLRPGRMTHPAPGDAPHDGEEGDR